MNIDLTEKEFRRLLDLVYIGNWILNSTRASDPPPPPPPPPPPMFSQCTRCGMYSLIQRWKGHVFPSRAYENGGIHEAIADYEDAVFFDILAEELARRDLNYEGLRETDELARRMDEYMDEFEKNGIDNLRVEP